MPTVETTVELNEEGAGKVTMTFTKADGTATTPTELNWSLCDKESNVINSREEVAVTGDDLDSTVVVTLNGDDLAIQTNEEHMDRGM